LEDAAGGVEEIIARETRAWDTQDVELLLSVFHPDMVWFWPPDNSSHDPVTWESPLGRFDRDRWRESYARMFADYELGRNDRRVVRIEVTPEGDGALAVVDIDTRWKHRVTGEIMSWTGRTAKTYVLAGDGWKMVAQSGVLLY
jgi:hypothetical protein